MLQVKQQFIEAGRVVNTHGVKGEVKIEPWTDSAEFLQRIKTLYIDGAAVKVRASRVHGEMLLAELEGVDNINEAMRLKGRVLSIDRADAPLPEGGYFMQDIIGARVVDESGGEIGTLSEVFEAPAGFVFVVKGGAEHLIPNVPEFIKSVDPEGGVIVARLIEGM